MGWVIPPHPVVPFGHFSECMLWSPGGSSERCQLSAGGFLLGKLVEVLDLEAGQGQGFACQRVLLPPAPG